MLPSVSHQKNLKSQTSQSDVASFSSDDNQSSSILSPGPVNGEQTGLNIMTVTAYFVTKQLQLFALVM